MITGLGITWAATHNSVYFIFFIFALLLIFYRFSRTQHLIRALGKTVHGRKFLHYISRTRVLVRTILWCLGLFFLFIVLLHPCWNTAEQTLIQENRNLFIALDISASMLAQDVKPNRLEYAKSKIRSLLKQLPTDRLGLILFSGSSFVQCPLTRDHGAFFMFLDQIDSDTIAHATTALDTAIRQAITAFKQAGIKKNKLLIIVTDGEDFSRSLASLKQEAAQEGLTIFTIGIGTPEGSPIPQFDAHGRPAGHIRDKKGAIVISRLNEVILQTLAQDVGGTYIHSTDNDQDIQSLITLIQRYEQEKSEEKKMATLQEQYPIFVAISFILLAIEWLL